MSRYAFLLLLGTVLGCDHTDHPTEFITKVCPCYTFKLANINKNELPYTPGFVNPHALMADTVTFFSDGLVEEVSYVRTIGDHNDTTFATTRKTGRYVSSPPLVTVAWPTAGNLTYALVNDSLTVGLDRVKEIWTYTRQY